MEEKKGEGEGRRRLKEDEAKVSKIFQAILYPQMPWRQKRLEDVTWMFLPRESFFSDVGRKGEGALRWLLRRPFSVFLFAISNMYFLVFKSSTSTSGEESILWEFRG